MPGKTQRHRRDHILPQGYLAGFSKASTPGRVEVYDIKQPRWFSADTRSVAAVKGFYDYSEDGAPDATADEVFDEFETKFPPLIRTLADEGFSGWAEHRDFLVRYAQMLRARSSLFREQSLKAAESLTMLQIEEVLEQRPSLTRPGEMELVVRYAEVPQQSPAREKALFKNLSITQMRAEIANGSGYFAGWHWCLRFTTDVSAPVITADDAVGVSGPALTLAEALKHPDSLFWFPMCWQACLIGSPQKFDVETDRFHPSDLRLLQRRYLSSSCRFAYSPIVLSGPKDGPPPSIPRISARRLLSR